MARFGGRHATRLASLACLLQEPISRGRTDGEQLRADRISKMHMAMLLEDGHERGEKRHQAAGADAVGRTPGDFQGGLQRSAVGWRAGSADLRRRRQVRPDPHDQMTLQATETWTFATAFTEFTKGLSTYLLR